MRNSLKGLSIKNIITVTNGIAYNCENILENEISGVSIDSRKVEANDLYIPFVGEKVDGHSFINNCFEKGALCTLSEKKLTGFDKPYILVKSSLKAIQAIALFYRNSLKVKIVGITGSVGKTSTKEIISATLSSKYNVLKTDGNYNNEIGLPLTIFKITSEHDIAVLEMGISDFNEMSLLASIAIPDVCVITNIGYCHLETLHDQDGILKAKTEMFEYLNPNGIVILNGDDDKLRTISTVNNKKPIFYGLNKEYKSMLNDYWVDNIVSEGLDGSTCTINSDKLYVNVNINIPGEHMIYNAMAAVAVAIYFDMNSSEIVEGMNTLQAVSGRINIIKNKELTIIDDCYNANPISMMAALDVLEYAKGYKTAILGDMFELGEDEIALHTKVGNYALTKDIDRFICIGSLSKNIYEAIKKEKRSLYYETIDAFLNDLNDVISKEETVLIKASHSMNFNLILNSLLK